MPIPVVTDTPVSARTLYAMRREMARHNETAQDDAERELLAHYRGRRHLSTDCYLCKVDQIMVLAGQTRYDRGYAAGRADANYVAMIAEG